MSAVSRPTSTDVARRAGVSRATVSHVLNGTDHPISEATRQRVLAAARDLHYAPNASARALRAGRSNIVLLPMPRSGSLPGQDVFLAHLGRELAGMGLDLLLHGDHTASGVEGARMWAELRPAAVFLDTSRGTQPAVALLRQAGVQAVLLSGVPAGPYAPSVPIDPSAVARVATRHLLSQGHRRLSCLVPGGEWAALAERRFEAVVEAAQIENALVERVDCSLAVSSIAPAVARWRNPAHRPDAVYAYNDEFALMLIYALREAGLDVPRDIAVVGSGNQPLGAILRPTLTTTHFLVPDLAHAVASSLRRLLDGRELDPALAAAVQPRLIVRESA
ncbi:MULTISPECIES: LacI family DNA-binding transcriptional regulator [unclassified Pseudofrankia]|uniref:LacI family DNA-binding transcriptional regulator n=1 Tax=unclassified Pseudofrankia TaxID=2994372 RepID=UPI0008D8FDF0|nr:MULTISPECIES: LacI family DNA-binding transcriptional regulator [unclassified Pseudofrankia]MDT3439159.1 LacI family DNA-binding transcriptional regulator [Pseudofrankia sp. BMG5.37]OHV45729.1 LacI family transcriptional regulator [Pseudofrankia sp. BMG5.36]